MEYTDLSGTMFAQPLQLTDLHLYHKTKLHQTITQCHHRLLPPAPEATLLLRYGCLKCFSDASVHVQHLLVQSQSQSSIIGNAASSQFELGIIGIQEDESCQ